VATPPTSAEIAAAEAVLRAAHVAHADEVDNARTVVHADDVEHASQVKSGSASGWGGMNVAYRVMFIVAVVLLIAAFIFVPILSLNQSQSNHDLIVKTTSDDSAIVSNQNKILDHIEHDIAADNANRVYLAAICKATPGCVAPTNP
jgi:hypothetical protein